jgi:hypothetical protein
MAQFVIYLTSAWLPAKILYSILDENDAFYLLERALVNSKSAVFRLSVQGEGGQNFAQSIQCNWWHLCICPGNWGRHNSCHRRRCRRGCCCRRGRHHSVAFARVHQVSCGASTNFIGQQQQMSIVESLALVVVNDGNVGLQEGARSDTIHLNEPPTGDLGGGACHRRGVLGQQADGAGAQPVQYYGFGQLHARWGTNNFSH